MRIAYKIILPHNPDFLTTLGKKPLKNIVGKEKKNAGNQHFLLFSQCFLSFPNQISVFQQNLSYVNAFNLVTSKILLFVEGLMWGLIRIILTHSHNDT